MDPQRPKENEKLETLIRLAIQETGQPVNRNARGLVMELIAGSDRSKRIYAAFMAYEGTVEEYLAKPRGRIKPDRRAAVRVLSG